ncbi:MAG TPA: heavy metal transporter, partial [Syntrophomonadaceae bacterium]|nr:heavy metal transporter [Syntrophomonadaceae bacterium]
AEKSDLNGCNNPVTIPKYDIEKRLVPGDNLIEFTPVEAGNITYTCWMGMISSTIKVVENISALSDQDLQQLNTASPGTARGGCCSR